MLPFRRPGGVHPVIIMNPSIRKTLIVVISFLCLGIMPGTNGCDKKRVFKETRSLMGTAVSVEISGISRSAAGPIMAEIWAEAERLEEIFSRYLAGSEVSRVNREASRKPVRVGEEMLSVLERSRQISRMTGGAFDITIAPLLKLWGFFPERKGRVPAPAEIKNALQRVDWRSVVIDRGERSVRLLRPGMEIDLGGLAKGYVVDRITALLIERGVESALVNAGGDIYCLGERPGGGEWRIGVEHPRKDGQVLEVLRLRDRAVASSGDYQNCFIRSRKRYSHIIDPRTGRPADSAVAETTVLAPNCLVADALATAVFVLGAGEGMELLNDDPEVEGIVVTEEEDDLKLYYSAGLMKN